MPNLTQFSQSKATGVQRLGILSNPTQFAQGKANGPEVLRRKKLSIPLDLLRARKKTSEILTNQKAAKYVQRIFSHSICSEQILKLVKPSEDSFPDLNTIYIRGQFPDLNLVLAEGKPCFSQFTSLGTDI